MSFKIISKMTGDSKIFMRVPASVVECAPHSIRVIPRYFGICGSDLFHYANNADDEICFGHEWIGEVVEVGSEVQGIKVHDTVTTSSTLGCGECVECKKMNVNYCYNPVHLGSPKMGALMGEMVFNAFNARVLNSHAKSEVLIEVMAVAEEAVKLMKNSTGLNGKKILVMGAGTVGILIAHLLNQEGLNVTITDPHATRIERAQKLKLKAFNLRAFGVMSEPNSFDVIFDATSDRGNEKGGMEYWGKFAALHFHLLVVGKYLKTSPLNVNVLSKLGGHIQFMRGVPLDTMEHTISQWSARLGEIASVVVSHEYSLEQIEEAFTMALSNERSGKVIVQIN